MYFTFLILKGVLYIDVVYKAFNDKTKIHTKIIHVSKL